MLSMGSELAIVATFVGPKQPMADSNHQLEEPSRPFDYEAGPHENCAAT